MICKKCGEDIPDDSQFCPFCAEEIEHPAAPDPTPPPQATAPMPPQPQAQPAPTAQQPAAPPPQQPVYQQPAAPPPQQAAPAQGSGSSCSGTLIAVLVAVLLLVVVVGGIGGYYVMKKLGTSAPPQQTADAGGESQSETPATTAETVSETPEDTGGTSATQTPETPAATTEPVTEMPETGGSSGGLDLDAFVGTWEFVGEPGPWGEGAPFSLERSGNILVGTAGLPYYDETIRLQLAAGNDQIQGESTTTYSDGETEVMSLQMQLDADSNLLTVTYRAADGEWLVRVAKRV